MSPVQRRMVLEHELLHVRRFDPLVNGLANLLLWAYWFHPLVWWAQRQLRLAREMAVDEAVVSRASGAEYAAALLALARTPHAGAIPASVGLGEGGSHVFRRVQRFLERPPQRLTRRAMVFGVLLLGVIAGAVLPLAQPAPPATRGYWTHNGRSFVLPIRVDPQTIAVCNVVLNPTAPATTDQAGAWFESYLSMLMRSYPNFHRGLAFVPPPREWYDTLPDLAAQDPQIMNLLYEGMSGGVPVSDPKVQDAVLKTMERKLNEWVQTRKDEVGRMERYLDARRRLTVPEEAYQEALRAKMAAELRATPDSVSVRGNGFATRDGAPLARREFTADVRRRD